MIRRQYLRSIRKKGISRLRMHNSELIKFEMWKTRLVAQLDEFIQKQTAVDRALFNRTAQLQDKKIYGV